MPTQTPEKRKLFASTPKEMILGVLVGVQRAFGKQRISAQSLRAALTVPFRTARLEPVLNSFQEYSSLNQTALLRKTPETFAKANTAAPQPETRRRSVRLGWLRHNHARVLAASFVVLVGLVTGLSFMHPGKSVAATNGTVNFQARLMSAAGAIAADGNYNVEFKLYTASTGGSALWAEDYLNANTQGIKVANGYLSANLGAVTAFPSTINWDQDLYLGMTVRGTGNCSFGSCTPADAEMTPRLKLTSTPYAFSAGKVSQYNGSAGYTSTLNLQAPTGGDQIFQIADQGAAGTYNLLTQSAADTGYIKNQTSLQASSNFNISGDGTVGGTFTGATINAGTALQTGGTTRIDSSGNLTNIVDIGASGTATIGTIHTNTFDTAASGTLTIGSTNATNITLGSTATTGTLTLGQSTAANTISIGSAAIASGNQTITIGTGSTGSGADIVTIGSTNGTSATTINAGSGGIALNGGVTTSSTVDAAGGFKVNGTAGVTQGTCSNGTIFAAQTTGGLVTGGSCAAVALGPGSTYYIQNGTSPQTGDFNITGTGTAATLQAGTFDTAAAGALGIGTTNATSIVLKQNTSLASGKTLTVNGSGFDASGNLGIGTTTPGANIDVQSTATTGKAVNITANSLTTGTAMSITTNSGGNTSGITLGIADTGVITSAQSQTGNELNVSRSLTANITNDPAIALDSKSAASLTTFQTSKSWSHTVGTGSNRFLVVTASVSCGANCITEVDYFGTPLTRQVTKTKTGSSEIWTLKNPASGTHTITVFTTGSYGVYSASSWNNVDQTNPIDSTASFSGTGSFVSGSVTSSASDMVIDNAESSYPAVLAAQGSQTQLFNDSISTSIVSSASYITGSASSTSMSESSSSDPSAWAYSLISLRRNTGSLEIDGSVASLSSNCTLTSGGCVDQSNILSLNQQYASATGAVVKLQNAGSGDMIDFLNGSGTTVASVDASGNFVSTGTVTGGTIKSGTFDAATAGVLNIGTTTATSLVIGNNNVTSTLLKATSVGIQSATDNASAFTITNSSGATIFNIDTTNTGSGTNVAVNGGAEAGTTTPTGWAVHGASTLSRDTSIFASGTASAKAITVGTVQGLRDNVGTAMTASSTYNVSFSIRTGSVTIPNGNLAVVFSPTGTTGNNATCVAGSSNPTISNSAFSKYTCVVTTTSTVTTSSAYLAIYQTDSASRSLYVDNLSITQQNSSGSFNTGNVRLGGATTQGLILLTLDSAASNPFTGTNAALAGSMYFDTTAGSFQCYDGIRWGNCGVAPNTSVTLTPEYANAVLHGSGSGTLTADFCSSSLGINDGSASQPTVCGSGETNNYYKWTSTAGTAQTYSVYVTYKLPSNFKSFVSGSTSVLGKTDTASNTVQYSVYKNVGGTLTQCGTAVSVSTGAQTSWQTGTAGGAADPSTCSFAAGNSIVFKVDVTSINSGNAYAGNINFQYANQ